MSIEDRLRDMFARRVTEVKRSEDAWDSINRRIERGRRRAAMSRLMGTAAVLILFAGVISLLWMAFLTRGERTSSPGGPLPEDLNPQVRTAIPVGPLPSSVAVGEGSVWVSIPERNLADPCSGAVTRIDPQTNQVVETVATSGTPSAAAVGEGAVWIAHRLCAPDGGHPTVVLRIDPSTTQLMATIPIGDPPAVPIDIAVDATGVWVTIDLDGGATGQVIHIDETTNEVLGRVDVEGRLRDVVVGEGATWVLNTDQDNPSVVRIDPAAHRVEASIALTGSPEGLAAGGGAVWTSSGRIDPRTNEIEAIPLESTFDPFAVGEGGVWFRGLEVDTHTISRLNTRTLQVDESLALDVFPIAAALDLDASAIWVADQNDSVVRIDLRRS
jgi:DNA-binding beta-propeller fold protein YncE